MPGKPLDKDPGLSVPDEAWFELKRFQFEPFCLPTTVIPADIFIVGIFPVVLFREILGLLTPSRCIFPPKLGYFPVWGIILWLSLLLASYLSLKRAKLSCLSKVHGLKKQIRVWLTALLFSNRVISDKMLMFSFPAGKHLNLSQWWGRSLRVGHPGSCAQRKTFSALNEDGECQLLGSPVGRRTPNCLTETDAPKR